MNIPFLDLRSAFLAQQEEIEGAVLRVLRSGRYIGGDEVISFERDFADYCETSHAIGVANGLDAITLSLRALGVSHGDEVIVPSNTFIATWLAVTECGALPVPVEPDANTFNIDPEHIAEALTERTKAIIAVHLYGQPADLDPILAVAAQHGIALVEDAAQAHGARYKGQRIGAHGDAVTWSFYPGKNLGALGDGGAVTTRRGDLARKVSLLRNYGSEQRYVNELRGMNSRLDPVQAAVLSVKLDRLDAGNRRRQEIAQRYTSGLRDTSLQLPFVPQWAEPVWHLYCVRHAQRDQLKARLAERGVDCLIHYPIPPHLQEAYSDLGMGEGRFPVAEAMANQLLSLPIDPLLDDAQVDYVIDSIRSSLDEIEAA